MAGMTLEISRLQGHVKPKELVAYFNELRAGVGGADSAILESLLEAVEHDLVSTDIFSIFISWSKSPVVISRCLNYGSNATIRSLAYKQLGKHMRRPGKFNWAVTWEALGGTEGLVQIFGRSSVAEVKAMSMFIGCCNRGKGDAQRERYVEQLLRALLPGVYGSTSTIRSRERRPIQHHYAKMLPACSPGFVNEVLDSRDKSNPLFGRRDLTRLVQRHRALVRERAVSHLFGSVPEDEDVPRYLDTLLYGDEDFATKALQGRLDGTVTDQRWGDHDEIKVLMPIVHRLAKSRRAPVEVRRRIHDLIKLGLEILGKDRDRRRVGPRDLWTVAFSRWRTWPDEYEDVLRLGLKSGLAKLPHKEPPSSALRLMQPGQRERLLQLYYLDVPEKPLDIFAAEDYSTVAKQAWSLDFFRLLRTDQAIRLLNKLNQANPEYSFLQVSGGTSIIPDRNIGPHHNFNVDLYLTMLQRGDDDVQQNARATIDRLRKKASAAREQSDRAALAKAAASYAIATGDLDVYGETVVWQQRFVRDPLTAKVLFGRKLVRTDEGVELLSGVPTPETLSPASKGNMALLLDEVSRGIRRADAVLRTFQESYLLATREPSFKQHDWIHMKGLFNAVLSSRVSRSETLQRHFAVPRNEVYEVVWKGLLAALEWLDTGSISDLRATVQAWLQSTQPKFLAAATRSLLDIGSERRKRHETDTDETLEQMSYMALVRLASSDMPELASPLILQTILERPDASSWHRILLSVGFLKKLRADEAHEMLLGLAKGIGEKLEEQSYVRVGESDKPKHVPSQPAVKVTTVKYLAQLLNKADFISNDAAVEVLVELFKAAQHRDIRLAALDSLLSLLDSICTGTQDEIQTNPAVRNIMAALKTVVPVAGSINERRPLREQDWTEAETTGTLPELSDMGPGPGDLPALMEAVVGAVSNEARPSLKKLETEFLEHIILPVLEQNQQEHTRWVSMFLDRHQATALKDDVPETPIAPGLWTTVLRNFYHSVPKEHLAAFNRYWTRRIAPTPAVNKFCSSLRADTALRKTPEVQHWLGTFDCGSTRTCMSETSTLFTLLEPLQDQPSERGALLDMILQRAALYLGEYEKFTAVFEDLTSSLAPTPETMRNESCYKRWYNNRRFIALRVIDLIKDKRRQGRRLILPSTTKMELWLLFTVGWYGGDNECAGFVSRLDERLQAMLREDETCALRWPEIAREACQVITEILTTDDERLRVAHHVGRLGHPGQAPGESETSRQLGMASDLIKLEVALGLINQCRENKIGDSLTRRVEEWRACDSDAIRERVFRWGKDRKST